MVLDGSGWLWVVVDHCGWLREVAGGFLGDFVGGYVWLWMVVGGCGWLCDGCGWLWVVAYFRITHLHTYHNQLDVMIAFSKVKAN